MFKFFRDFLKTFEVIFVCFTIHKIYLKKYVFFFWGNRSADWLVNFSLSLDSFDLHVIVTPPRERRCLIFDDISSACMPQNVRLIT